MSKRVGIIWDSEIKDSGQKPFIEKYDHLNETYSYFTELAEKEGLEVYIANFKRYEDGILTKAYHYNDGWEEKRDIELDVIFDKFKFDSETRELKKEMHSTLPMLNAYDLEKIAKDKMLTFKEFPEHVLETRKATEENVSAFLEQDGKAVIKPRSDFGGRGVKVIETLSEFDENEEELLVQRFVDSSQGIPELDVEGVHDLRVVVVNGEPVLSYVRTPSEGYISNVSQGGSMQFIDLNEIPEEAMKVVGVVKSGFQKFEPYVFGVDMIFDEKGKVGILEINSKPGLSFQNDDRVKNRKLPYLEAVIDSLSELA